MLDLETLGTDPGSVVFAVGAVAFNADGVLSKPFYALINIEDAELNGLAVDKRTIEWWSKQSAEARTQLDAAEVSENRLVNVLTEFTNWVMEQAGDIKSVRMWGAGSDFDCVLLKSCYQAVGMEQPWTYRGVRCFRTLSNLMPGLEPKREGVHHNALDDATHQARWCAVILNKMAEMRLAA